MSKNHPAFCLLLTTTVGLYWTTGCNRATPPQSPAAGESAAAATGHASHGAGPHDGTLAEWGGGKYHVEFTVDHDARQATVYVLSVEDNTPVPIAAETIELAIQGPPLQVTLRADPQIGEAEGMSSRFVGQHESLAVVREYAGTITGLIDGTPYSADFQEHAHEAGGHDHE